MMRKTRNERRFNKQANRLAGKEIEVRWDLPEDGPKIGQLLELNGMSRALAFEERFIVAEKRGEVLAAVRCRTESKRLLLGLVLADPWAGERRLAVALYAGAGELAREIGAKEVLAHSILHEDYPHEAGYRRTVGGWRLDPTRPLYRHRELPRSGWRRKVALLGIPAIPFFAPKSGS